MVTTQKINYWVVGSILFCVFLYLISDILLPFVFGILVAYFLDPVADRMEEKGLSRTGATITILASFFSVVILVLIMVLPALADQLLLLASKIPVYIEVINNKIEPKLSGVIEKLNGNSAERVQSVLGDISGYIFHMAGRIISNIWSSGVAALNLLSLLLISPVVAFYLLRDWDRITAKIDKLLPRKNAKTIKKIVEDIDDALAGFIRGQASVIGLLGIFYAAGLAIVGLDSALVIGIGAGLLTIIPYVGIIFGALVGLTVSYFQFSGDLFHILSVAVVFIVGQFIEGNFITPKLVGDRVGLHPVWIIFGMLAGGSLFGFVGILLAIPVTAVIGVLVRFSTSQYMNSEMYSGGKKSEVERKRKKIKKPSVKNIK